MTAKVTPARRTPPRKPSHWLRNASIGVIAVFVLLAALGFRREPPDEQRGANGSARPGFFRRGSSDRHARADSGQQDPAFDQGHRQRDVRAVSASGDSVDVTYDYTCTECGQLHAQLLRDPRSALLPDVLAKRIRHDGSGTTTESLNGATGPFHVEVDSACAWSIEVVGTP